MRTDILDRKEEILQWIAEEQPKVYMAKQLHCKQETLNSYLKKMGIEYDGQQSKKGQYKGGLVYKPASYYIDNNIIISSSKLREKLIRDGVKEAKCEICGISTWFDVNLPLELHHKDGNHFNNHLDNLQILCPNCHAIQNGNSGANIGAYKNITVKKRAAKYCVDCGKKITGKSTRCEECYHKNTKGVFKVPLEEMPVSREELKQLIRTTPFVKIGQQFNVTDNAIRKWCKKFNLPSRVSEIKQITDADWINI